MLWVTVSECIFPIVLLGTMVIDGKEYTGTSHGRFQGLDLTQFMYVGGVADYNFINNRAGFTSGFIGRLSENQKGCL
jgi:hypothetical protein